MYYRLNADLGLMNVYLQSANNEFTSLISGNWLDDDDYQTPFEFGLEVKSGGSDQAKSPIMFDYFPSKRIMSQRLVDTIRGAGAENLQTFPARLTAETDGRVWEDYLAVNVIGLVSCANVAESDTAPIAGMYYFYNLVIDPSRTQGLYLFRLAESPIEVIVHQKVADAIRAGNFSGVMLEPLKESAEG